LHGSAVQINPASRTQHAVEPGFFMGSIQWHIGATVIAMTKNNDR
jgi:hypothetical protein